MPCRLIETEGKCHFITRRFDRDKDRKLHMQTLAALYPEADSYEKLLMVCRKMRLPESAQEEVFRRMVFNYLANNTDDHNKNFSFLMDENGCWRLSPAYDMTYIFNAGGRLPETMHCLMMRGKLSGWTKDDALALAKENGIRKAETIISEVAEAVRNFRSYAVKNNVQIRWTNAVEQTLISNLDSWGLNEPKKGISLSVNGHELTGIRIEQTYKGNFHLVANVDGTEKKYVIAKNKEEYTYIETVGAINLSEEYLATLARKYLLR